MRTLQKPKYGTTQHKYFVGRNILLVTQKRMLCLSVISVCQKQGTTKYFYWPKNIFRLSTYARNIFMLVRDQIDYCGRSVWSYLPRFFLHFFHRSIQSFAQSYNNRQFYHNLPALIGLMGVIECCLEIFAESRKLGEKGASKEFLKQKTKSHLKMCLLFCSVGVANGLINPCHLC